MNFSEPNTQSSLPQFSEISSRPIVTTSNYASSGNDQLQGAQSITYTTAADSNNMHSPNKLSNAILNWPEHSTLMQFCEKQGLQTINIPAYNQNNSVLSVQTHNLPMRIIPNVYIPQADGSNEKSDPNQLKNGSEETNCNTLNSQVFQQHCLTEYLQKIQTNSLPLTIQQLIKLQQTEVKKEKDDEQKSDQTQNNILNIPSVPMYKNTQMQNDSQYLTTEHGMLSLNPSDVNVHIEEQTENHNNSTQNQTQTNNKIEQTVQVETAKPEKKIKFRAKIGEIKLGVALDGSTIYCCPDCSVVFPHKSEIDQHMQIHVQERKYQCKECGAMLKRKEHLDQHMRGHSDERPFKCPMCHKAFKRNEHLTRHYVIHSGDKNFSCQVCQKAFSRKDHLNKHAQTHLGIKKPKPKKETIELPTGDGNVLTTTTTASMLLRPDINNLLKDSPLKPDTTTQFLQHIQNLQKDSNLMQTFHSAFKEHILKDGSSVQQQAVNMNEILPQNTRYLMPS